MYRQRTNTFATIAATLTLLSALLLTACVTTQPDLSGAEIYDLPSTHAAVLIAVTDDIPSNQLEVTFNDQFSVFLKANTINKLYLPEDWYTMQLTRLPQEFDNAVMRYRLAAGEISRFVLLKRSEYKESESNEQETVQTVTYNFAASTAFGFDYMQNLTPYPVVNIVPQKLSD